MALPRRSGGRLGAARGQLADAAREQQSETLRVALRHVVDSATCCCRHVRIEGAERPRCTFVLRLRLRLRSVRSHQQPSRVRSKLSTAAACSWLWVCHATSVTRCFFQYLHVVEATRALRTYECNMSSALHSRRCDFAWVVHA